MEMNKSASCLRAARSRWRANINIAIARQPDFVFASGAQLLGQLTRKRWNAFFPRFTTQRL